jgi:hypothetical protein
VKDGLVKKVKLSEVKSRDVSCHVKKKVEVEW